MATTAATTVSGSPAWSAERGWSCSICAPSTPSGFPVVVQEPGGEPGLDERSLRVYEALLRFWRPLEERLRPRVGLSLVAQAAPLPASAG